MSLLYTPINSLKQYTQSPLVSYNLYIFPNLLGTKFGLMYNVYTNIGIIG